MEENKHNNTCTAVPVRKGSGAKTSCSIPSLITCNETTPGTQPCYIRTYVHPTIIHGYGGDWGSLRSLDFARMPGSRFFRGKKKIVVGFAEIDFNFIELLLRLKHVGLSLRIKHVGLFLRLKYVGPSLRLTYVGPSLRISYIKLSLRFFTALYSDIGPCP